MSTIHTSGYYFEVENFVGWNNGVSRFYYYQTVNTNEHIYSFSYNGASITPNSNYETIVYKTNQSAWFDYDGSSNPWSLTTTNGVTEGTDSNGDVMMKWGHTGFPDPTISASGGGTSSEGVNVPYVTWAFPSRSCGETTYVQVTHTVAQSVATTYYVHELGVGQIGTILVGTGAHPNTSGSANYGFTISARTLQVKDASGSVLGTRVFTCRNKKVHSNFW
jgi:hypothetical protein